MDMHHAYDLAFVAPKRKPRTAPEIVFIIDERNLAEFIDNLHIINRRLDYVTEAYLADENVNFTLPVPDLFGHKEFGYRKCGYMTMKDNKVHLRIQLRMEPWTEYCALTIFMLTKALSLPSKTTPPSNRLQPVELATSCSWRPEGYGHAMGGWISSEVMQWLRSYSSDKVEKLGIIEAAPMHPLVIRAMQAAWYATNPPRRRQYASASHIYGWVREDGAFSLVCFGNACDLSVYPDAIDFGYDGATQLSCHNLDHADQQLTLLAGLAKLCELARDGS